MERFPARARTLLVSLCAVAAASGGGAGAAGCARKAGVETLLTWDLEGFERFLEDEPAVQAPEER